MKQFSKFFAVVIIFSCLLSCQDGTDNIFNDAGNKHDNARTAANFYASGTVTVPAGTYETIVCDANAVVTLAHGVKFNDFDYNGVNISIKTATGATVTHYQAVWIPTGVTFTNSLNATLNSKKDFLVGATTVDNLGTHNIDVNQSLILDQNATYNASLFSSFNAWRVWFRQPGAKIDFGTGSPFAMPNMTMSVLRVEPQITTTNGAFYGKGKITITGSGTVQNQPLTGSSTIKVCTSTPLIFSNGGSFGIGYYGC